jgi:predicted ATP-dependent serine protease
MQLNIDSSTFTKVSDIQIPDVFYRRMKTGVTEIDELFGEGILPGSSFTVTARAGCGKTTFLLQVFEALANMGYSVGYTSGEENTFQLAFNCRRLNVKSVRIANLTDVEEIVSHMADLDAIVIDSFQSLSSKTEMNTREFETYAVNTLVQAAKTHECSIFFIMHLTKAGVLKGGTLIPHTVDVNMMIEVDEEAGDDRSRIISFYKNRFGPCNSFSTLLTETGFMMLGKYVVMDSTINKKQRMKSNSDKVLAMTEPPFITKKRVMNELNLTSSQAYVLLKEMCDRDLIKKFGRGDDAVYKAVRVNIDQEVEADF